MVKEGENDLSTNQSSSAINAISWGTYGMSVDCKDYTKFKEDEDYDLKEIFEVGTRGLDMCVHKTHMLV